jgi:hypothetical protein
MFPTPLFSIGPVEDTALLEAFERGSRRTSSSEPKD